MRMNISININDCFKISKTLILFFIFTTASCDKHHHSNISLFNNNICNSLKTNNFVPFRKPLIMYTCKHRGVSNTRKTHNPYAVFATDILRKYIYIVNVVIIYIILYSL
jgi:hypothetical protein